MGSRHIGTGIDDAPTGEDIPARLAALRETVGAKVKEAEPQEVLKKKKIEKDSEVADKETKAKTRKRKKARSSTTMVRPYH